jgi:hypothetical protein
MKKNGKIQKQMTRSVLNHLNKEKVHTPALINNTETKEIHTTYTSQNVMWILLRMHNTTNSVV